MLRVDAQAVDISAPAATRVSNANRTARRAVMRRFSTTTTVDRADETALFRTAQRPSASMYVIDFQCEERCELVGARGFEPPTPRSRTECSTRLSHAPTT